MNNLTGFPSIFQGDTSATASTLNDFILGMRALDVRGNEYIYAKGTASVAVNDWVIYDEGYNVERTGANDRGMLVVAQSENPLGSFGWYLVRGTGTASMVTGPQADDDLYLTSTAGSMGSADVGGDAVTGGFIRGDELGGSATVQLSNPTVHNIAFD